MRFFSDNLHEKRCTICGATSSKISAKIGVCKNCLITNFEESIVKVEDVRNHFRKLGLQCKNPEKLT